MEGILTNDNFGHICVFEGTFDQVVPGLPGCPYLPIEDSLKSICHDEVNGPLNCRICGRPT